MLQFSLPEEGGRPPKHVAENIEYFLRTCYMQIVGLQTKYYKSF
jgi:hypothetical protein